MYRTLLASVETYVVTIAEGIGGLRADTNESVKRLEERSAKIEAHLGRIRSY